jgi:O-antigen/teichoic acid export membrane protein
MKGADHFALKKHSAYHFYMVGAQLITGIFIARALGPEGLGILALIFGTTLLLSPIINIPCGLNLLRELNTKEQKDKISWTISANKLVHKIILLLLLLWSGVFLTISLTSNTNYLFLGSLCVLLFLLSHLIEKKGTSIFLLKENLGQKLRRDAIATTISGIVKILITFTHDPDIIILGSFIGLFIECLCIFLSNKKVEIKEHFKLYRPLLGQTQQMERELLKEGLVLLPNALAAQASETIKRFSLASYSTPEIGKKAVGDYTISQRQSIILTITGQILYERYKGLASLKVLSIYTLGAATITAITIPLIPFIFGADFSQAMTTAMILLIPNSLSIIAQGQTALLISHKKSKLAITISTTGLLLTALTSIILTPFLGIVGIALAVILGEMTIISWGFALMKNIKKISQEPL